MQADTDPSIRLAQKNETLFLRTLYNALRMDQKSLAVHNWFRHEDICAFTGVQCDVNRLVTILDLSSKGLAGTLPPSFSPLIRLERLLLRNNNIQGDLPYQFPETLLHLNVDRNRLQGTIPSFEFTSGILATISNAPNLERLIISDNLLEGIVPTTLCQLTKLKALNLSRNPQMQGTLPECLVAFTELTGLQLQGTRLIVPSHTPTHVPTIMSSAGFTQTPFMLHSSPPTSADTWVPSSRTTSDKTLITNRPITTSTPAIPTSRHRPNRWSPLKHFKFGRESNDEAPSSTPTLQPSNAPSRNKFVGTATDRPDRPFYDGPAFIPVFLSLCLFSMGAFCFAIPTIRSLVLRQRRNFKACGSVPSDAIDSLPWIDNTLSHDEEEIIFEKEGQNGNIDDSFRRVALESVSSGICEVSPLDYSDTNWNQPASNLVTCRPCVVRPQTLAANPRVRFLLLAKSRNSAIHDEPQSPTSVDHGGGEDDPSITLSDKELGRPKLVTQQRATSCSSMSSILCASPFMSAQANSLKINASSTEISQELDGLLTHTGEEIAPHQYCDDPHERLTIKADSSSLSSTTPMLNPIECCHSSGSKLFYSQAQLLSRGRKHDDVALADYARKYFPDEGCATSPPVKEVDCSQENEVSFSWSTSNDDRALQEGPTYQSDSRAVQNSDQFSFRPPRYYKKNVTTRTTTPHVWSKGQRRNYSEYVLGIRSPFVDHHCDDDDYEIEVFEKEESKTERRVVDFPQMR